MFSTVDPRQLASISGGRKSASDLVLDKLTDRFPVGLGFVSYIGDPNVSATKKRGRDRERRRQPPLERRHASLVQRGREHHDWRGHGIAHQVAAGVVRVVTLHCESSTNAMRSPIAG